MNAEVTVSVPGKIIIAGEHAVVMGAPAIVCAIDQHLTVTLSSTNLTEGVVCHFADKTTPLFAKHSPDELPSPLDYIKQALDMFAISFGTYPHCDIQIDSELPAGCGFGASAALALALLHSLRRFYHHDMDDHALLAMAQQIESRQHGKSSGIDIHACWHGGAWRVEGDKRERIELAQHLPFAWYNSGHPRQTTADCVAQSLSQMQQHPKQVDQARMIVDALSSALSRPSHDDIHTQLQAYHHWLCQIGVVPKVLADQIAQWQAYGISAKIAGAGALSGHTAGCILLFGKYDRTQLANLHPLLIDHRGAYVVH